MAEVRLKRYAAGPKQLPPVCIRCGAPAITCARRRLSTTRLWWELCIWLTPVWMPNLAPPPQPAGVINAPVCRSHRHYWHWRNLILYGGYAIGITWLVLVAFSLVPEAYRRHVVFGFACFVMIWVPWAAIMWFTGIHVRKMDRRTLLLSGVSPEFADAVQRQQFLDDALVATTPVEPDTNNPFAGLTS